MFYFILKDHFDFTRSGRLPHQGPAVRVSIRVASWNVCCS